LAQQKARLRQAGYLPYFHHLFISEAIGFSKPAPAFFDACIAALNAPALSSSAPPILPENVLMVGDSLTSDMRGGIDSGLKTCYFNPEKKPVPSNLTIDFTIHRLAQLRDIVKKVMPC
ncbi:MAG: HAD hydrolase-like protein, partial [Clostridia bacterium]|nr:HAD hydrolase-like protein [Clostridia bacterium]